MGGTLLRTIVVATIGFPPKGCVGRVIRSRVQRSIKFGIGWRSVGFGHGPIGRPLKLEGEIGSLRRGVDAGQKTVGEVGEVTRTLRAYYRERIEALGTFNGISLLT